MNFYPGPINPGPIISATTTAITHSQRMRKIYEDNNKDNNEETTITNSTKNDSPMTPYQSVSLNSQKEILEEAKRILREEKCKDSNSISLYNILNLTHKKYREYIQFKHNLENTIHNLMKEDYFLSMYCVSFDCSNKFVKISHAKYSGDIHFAKKDGDLVIIESSFFKDTDILGKCGEYISIFYDYCVENKNYLESNFENIRSVNSNFLVSMSKDDVLIHSSEKYGYFGGGDFKLRSYAYDKEYHYNCNSNNITSAFRGNEDNFFSRVFVKIEDCPIWMKETLYQIRQEQLKEQEKEEIKEMKKQKRIELVRKLNPIRKK